MAVHLVVVTGSSRGIGAGIAAAAEAADAIVAPCNRTATSGEHELIADLSDPAAWPVFATWLDGLVDQLTPTRLTFIHNAAMIDPVGFAGEVDPAAYSTNLLLNAVAPQTLGDAVIRTAHRAGLQTDLVQLSSGAGKRPFTGWSSYCASKAAVDMWVRTVGLEQAERGGLVRALAIGPGVVDTGMQAAIREADERGFPQLEQFKGLHSAGQLADPAEVGATIWAISQQSDWENGAVGDLSLLA